MTSETSPPTPQLFFHTISGFHRTAALKAAIDLDLFTAVNEGNRTIQTLARRCNASERGVRILADFLTMNGFLSKEKGQYRLTSDTEIFLDRCSPAYMGGTVSFLLSTPFIEGFRGLTEAVRTGGTALGEGTLAPDDPAWVEFARSMVPMMTGPAEWIAAKVAEEKKGACKILDLAAGHGLFGVEIAKRNPEAEVVALDWANVLQVARERANKAGVAGRYGTLTGSAFDVEFGGGYDVVLLTNFLHHFDVPTCEKLLRKIHPTLKDDGLVATLEFVPNEDRISPASAEFGIIMLATTPSGDAYTCSELTGMFSRSGFSRNDLHALSMSTEHVMISRK